MGRDTLYHCPYAQDRIVHVHLKDAELVEAKPGIFENEVAAEGRLRRGIVFGKGVIPVKDAFERMCADGYCGVFAVGYIRPKNEICSLQDHESHIKWNLEHLMK